MGEDSAVELSSGSSTTGERPNNGLHQTWRGGVLASRAVVEARPAGEAKCSTGTEGREK